MSYRPAVDIETISALDRKGYRHEYKRKHDEFWKSVTREDFKGIEWVVVKAPPPDMEVLRGMRPKQVEAVINRFYANHSRFLNPRMAYPPSMLDNCGKEYALNARGIYYYDHFSHDLVTCTRKVWIPSLEGIDWDTPNERSRRRQAELVVAHSIRNEMRRKSEYAWEADAWSDIFGDMRDDFCLEIDKHKYYTEFADTNSVRCTLTGETSLVDRRPDATFGLAPFSSGEQIRSIYTEELRKDRLEKLLLHPKCGLISDPNWGEIDLVFPFAVYEAKGWSGDCREARHQACNAAVTYLDMLDNLGRRPGPANSARPYQTATSHQYQIFALTSFGAHWHILVGYRRPRQVDEFAEECGMSDTVYVFQTIWSGRVVCERTAWELLSLVDQIHQWGKTDFRSFVIEHLRPWHKFCEDNYLLEWNSVYDSGRQLKRKRNCSEKKDLALPEWANRVTEPHRRKIQVMAKRSLKKAIEEHRLRKGKSKAKEPKPFDMGCLLDECGIHQNSHFTSMEAYLEHLRSYHTFSEEEITQMQHCLDEGPEDDSGGMMVMGPEGTNCHWA